MKQMGINRKLFTFAIFAVAIICITFVTFIVEDMLSILLFISTKLAIL